MVTPSLGVGGAERWIIDMVRSTCNVIKWNVAASGWGLIDKDLSTELMKLCNVYCNKPAICVDNISIPLVENNYDGMIITGPDFGKCVQIASEFSDIIITWAVPDIGNIVPNFEGPIIYVSHTDVRSPVKIEGHTHQVGVSKQSLNHFVDKNKPTSVLWNGADPRIGTDTETWEIVNKWSMLNNVVGQIGRHVPLKQYLLTAEAMFQQKDLMFVNYGSNPQGEICPKLKQICEENVPNHYLSKPIKLIGSAISNFEAIIMPSLQEANSLAVIEAMLCRVPIITTNVGAIPEFEERFGDMVYKIDTNINAETLRSVIYKVLSTDNSKMISDNYNIALEHMTIEAMGKRWYNYMCSL